MGTNSAAKKREDARRQNGTFGHQHRDEPDTTIAWIAKQEINRVIDIDIDDPRLPHNADHVQVVPRDDGTCDLYALNNVNMVEVAATAAGVIQGRGQVISPSDPENQYLVDWLDANRGRIIETMHSQFGPNTSFEGDWVGEPEGWGGQDWDTQAIQTVFNFPGDTDLDDALRAVSESQAVNEVYKDVVKHRLLGIRLVFALDTTPCRPPDEQEMDDWCSDADANDRNITDEQAAGILRHVVATNCLRWPAEKNLSLKSSRVLAQFAHANTRPPKRAFLEALHEEWLASRGDVPRRLRLANLSGWANEHFSD